MFLKYYYNEDGGVDYDVLGHTVLMAYSWLWTQGLESGDDIGCQKLN